MKESMRKPVLFFMDLMVVFLAVILTIELIAIAGFTFPFMIKTARSCCTEESPMDLPMTFPLKAGT